MDKYCFVTIKVKARLKHSTTLWDIQGLLELLSRILVHSPWFIPLHKGPYPISQVLWEACNTIMLKYILNMHFLSLFASIFTQHKKMSQNSPQTLPK